MRAGPCLAPGPGIRAHVCLSVRYVLDGCRKQPRVPVHTNFFLLRALSRCRVATRVERARNGPRQKTTVSCLAQAASATLKRSSVEGDGDTSTLRTCRSTIYADIDVIPSIYSFSYTYWPTPFGRIAGYANAMPKRQGIQRPSPKNHMQPPTSTPSVHPFL